MNSIAMNRMDFASERSGMRELGSAELSLVAGGGITPEEAGRTLTGLAASAAVGAYMGAIGGPGGMIAGAIVGAGRAIVAYGLIRFATQSFGGGTRIIRSRRNKPA